MTPNCDPKKKNLQNFVQKRSNINGNVTFLRFTKYFAPIIVLHEDFFIKESKIPASTEFAYDILIEGFFHS